MLLDTLRFTPSKACCSLLVNALGTCRRGVRHQLVAKKGTTGAPHHPPMTDATQVFTSGNPIVLRVAAMSSSQVPAADGARYQPGAGGDHHGEGPHTGDHGHHAGDQHPPAADGEPTTLLGSAAAVMSRAGAAAVAAPVAAAATVSILYISVCGFDINIASDNCYKTQSTRTLL